MSALLVDDLVVTVPGRPQPGRWRHVDSGPQARPRVVVLPGGRPEGVAAPQVRPAPRTHSTRPAATASDSWQLTDRGIAVAVVLFLAVVAVAAVVLVGAFLSVSDAPIPTAPQAPVAAAAQG